MKMENKEETTMERKIGEIFEYNGEWYQCIVGNGCEDCAFNGRKCYAIVVDNGDPIGDCCADRREDNKDVIFKKLEKVGEPFTIVGKLYQYYKVFDIDNVCGDGFWCVHNYKAKNLTIEIKQTKEDMKKKKQCGDNRFRAIARAKEYLFQATNIAEDKKELEVLDSFLLRCWQMGWLKQYEDAEEKKLNLKPFDLQKAKEGKPVCTRDGRKARIICFDSKNDHQRPIVALVEHNDNELLYEYTIEGKERFSHISTTGTSDLMMLPEKKEGWVNVYKGGLLDTKSYPTKKEAFDKACPEGYVDTVKVEWEE